MYIVYNAKRNAYKTDGGWTTIKRDGDNGVLNGLADVIRFTLGESIANKASMEREGCTFVYFPRRRWCDL